MINAFPTSGVVFPLPTYTSAYPDVAEHLLVAIMLHLSLNTESITIK